MSVTGAVHGGTPPRTATSLTRSRPWRVAAAGLLATAVVVAVDPQHTHVPLCPFRAVTGLQCPLCGSLRAVNSLVRGHWAAAVHDNLLFVAALPVLLLLWLDWVRRSRTDGTARAWPRWATVVVIVVAVAFTVVRNLPAAAALRP